MASKKSREESPLLVAALEYASRGWPIFPCKFDKTPQTPNGVLDATTDPEKIEEWWRKWPGANIALDVGGAGMMVLDLDPGHDMVELERNVGALPATKLHSGTPRGGQHLFFDLENNELVSPSSSKVASHVDVRSFHSYVLLPPSQTKDGSYTWEGTGKPACRTQKMVDVANLARQKHKDRDDWIIEQDLPENKTLAIDWLRQTALPAIQGQGGDLLTYSTAAMCKSYGLSEGTALEAIWEHWNDRCDPPWDYEELAIKVANGYSYNTSPPGNMTPAYKVARAAQSFSPVEEPLSEIEPREVGPDGLYNGPEYASRPQPKWIIRDVMQEAGYAIASGRSQAGKSFCELAKALSVAMDKPWLGMEPETTGPVLYVAAEGQGRIWRDVCAWCAEFGVDPESTRDCFFIYDRSARLNTDAGRKALKDILAYIKHVTGRLPIYAVFDTLRRNMRGGVSQEEPTSDVLHEVNELQAAGIAVTLVAHHGRSHGETKGLTEWEDDADAVRHYTGTVRDGDTKITFEKVKGAEDGWSLAVEYAKRQLPEGETTLVAVMGRRIEPAATQASPQRDPYMAHRGKAMELLEQLEDPTIGRTALATVIMGELNPEGKESKSQEFANSIRALAGHLGRLPDGDPLWDYVAEPNEKGQPLTFRNPKHRGHRAPKPRPPRARFRPSQRALRPRDHHARDEGVTKA